MATKIWTGDADTEVYNTDLNWYDNTNPASADDVIIGYGALQNIAGADETAELLTSFLIEPGMPKTIGTHATSLQIDADTVNLAGTGEQFLSFTGTASLYVNQAAGSSAKTNYGLNLIGSTVTDTLIRCGNGKVAIGWQGQTAAYTNVLLETGTLLLDTGASVTALDATGGTLLNNIAVATVGLRGNVKAQWDIGAVTAMTCRENAQININSVGQITTLNLYDNCIVNFDGGGTKAIAIPNLNIYSKNVRIVDTNSRVTWTTDQIQDFGNYFGLGFSRKLDATDI